MLAQDRSLPPRSLPYTSRYIASHVLLQTYWTIQSPQEQPPPPILMETIPRMHPQHHLLGLRGLVVFLFCFDLPSLLPLGEIL